MLEIEDIKDLKEYINSILDSNDNNMIARMFNSNPIRYVYIDGKYFYLIDDDYIGLKYKKKEEQPEISCMATYVVVDVPPTHPLLGVFESNIPGLYVGAFVDMPYESDIILHKGCTLVHCNGAKISKAKYKLAAPILRKYHGCEEDNETISVPNWKVKKYKGECQDGICN